MKGVTKLILQAALEDAGTGCFTLKTSPEGEALGQAEIKAAEPCRDGEWQTLEIEAGIPDGVQPLYLIYTGDARARLLTLELQ